MGAKSMLCTAVVLLVPVNAGAEEARIYGRWRATETRVQLADGTTNKQNANCIAAYEPDRTISECDAGEGRRTRVVARLYNVTPSSYEIEVVEAASAPSSIGVKNKIDYRIEGNRMTVSAKPATAGAATTSATRIETLLVRE